MDFDFTPAQEALRQTVRKFVKAECPPDLMKELDEREEYPHEIWRRLAEIGLLGLPVPEEYGGSGGTVTDVVIAVEELSKAMTALGLMYLTCSCFGANSIGAYGTPEQKARFLPALTRGELRFCFGVTEPNSGMDTLSLTTAAVLEGDHYRVNGQKMFITGADTADYIVLLCRTGRDTKKRSDGLSVILVPTAAPGVEIRALKKLGLRAIHTTAVFLDNVLVPRDHLLGEQDKGWQFILHTMNNERITVSAYRLGTAQAALDYALNYARERVVFGRPIGQFQAVQHRLAEVAAEIEMARLLMYKAAWMQERRRPCGLEASMSKMMASEVTLKAVDAGMRTMAGYGYITEHPMERYLRDAWIGPTGTATNDMVKNLIAMNLGLPKSY